MERITPSLSGALRAGQTFFILLAILYGCATYGVYHTVRKGETLWRIANTYGVDMEAIARANGIRDPSDIKVGQELFIPGVTRVKKVRPYHFPSRGEGPQRIDKGRFIWPVKGKIIVRFKEKGEYRSNGIEIGASPGTPVVAADDGEVVYSGKGIRGMGNLVIIRHKGGFYTTYANNERNLVKEGQKVKQGEKIAIVGYSRLSNTSALYFEIRKGKRPRNPLFYLP